MLGIPWTKLLLGAFVGYLAYTAYTMYNIFMPKPCTDHQHCIKSYLVTKPKLGLQISTSTHSSPSSTMSTIWKCDNFTIETVLEKNLNVTVPLKTRKNGTLYIHAYLYTLGSEPVESSYLSHAVSKITTYYLPQISFTNLLGSKEKTDAKTHKEISENRDVEMQPQTHWRPRVSISVLVDDVSLDGKKLPGEIYQYIRTTKDRKHYFPIVYIDEFGYRMKDLLPVDESSVVMPLTITYSPMSLGKMRLWITLKESMKMMTELGFTEKDTDEIKSIFADTHFYLLMLTFTVAAFHLLFDFLAFKNDIAYWHGRETMIGLSRKVVIWRCVSTVIIFLYLMDENTSLLVLIPTGISMVIEIWKVFKALKITVLWSSFLPHFHIGDSNEQEKITETIDSQAMAYLSYILYPLCVGGAIYSLLFVQHRSWYSWTINSLVNGVYAFGFLFMLPQLFVNYKLKSVAHLPWRAFMYKAFNTFIDDVFAFIITMPTAHRVACFRDDAVFLVYLYQRWLYPVDKKRANEFGVSFEEKKLKKTK